MKSFTLALAFVLALAFSGSALAAKKHDDKDNAVFIKGGIGGYTGGLGDSTTAGPVWGVALNLQPTNVIGFELSYDGSRNELRDGRLAADNTPNALRNGASAMLKLGLPFIERIKPFVGAGLGASYVAITGDSGGLYRNDIMEEVPLAAGVEFNSGVFTAGFRAGYRVLVDEGFADPATNGGDPSGGLLDLAATIGGRF